MAAVQVRSSKTFPGVEVPLPFQLEDHSGILVGVLFGHSHHAYHSVVVVADFQVLAVHLSDQTRLVDQNLDRQEAEAVVSEEDHHLFAVVEVLVDRNHLPCHRPSVVLAVAVEALPFLSVAAFPLPWDPHSSPAAAVAEEGDSFDPAGGSHFPCHHSRHHIHRCSLAHSHCRNRCSRTHLEDTDRIVVAVRIAAGEVDLGCSLGVVLAAVQLCRCTAVEAAGNGPDHRPCCRLPSRRSRDDTLNCCILRRPLQLLKGRNARTARRNKSGWFWELRTAGTKDWIETEGV